MDESADELVEFRTADGRGGITVATGVDDVSGAHLISSGPNGPRLATRTFESALEPARAAAEAALRVFRDGRLKPDSVEIEFGVRITAETGAVLVKGAAEGHLVVKLAWTPERTPPASGAPGEVPQAGTGTSPGTSAATGSERRL